MVSRRQVLRGGVAAGAAIWLAPALAACSDPADDQLSFLNWQDYIDPTILTDFSKQSGLTVTYETFASNDELAKRLNLAGVARRRGREATSFDLIVPSDNLLDQLRTLDQLQELDDSIVKSLDNLAPAFRAEPFDPGNRFSVPWATGTTGIGYDATVFDEPPGWDVFLDEAFAGKMTVLDEERDAFAAALFSLGEDPNATDPAVVGGAADRLIEMKGVIAGFNSATYLDLLADGDLVCAHAYSTDVLQARERNPDLTYVVPEDGGLRWIDSLCIPIEAPNPDGANRFIEFYLQPEVSASNAIASKVDTGNAAAQEFVPPEILDDPAIYPSEADLERLVFTQPLDEVDQAVYDEAWRRVQAAPPA
ncbi:MAG: spermidine/putrescine ABC transporter substrate-binding protein [Actinomycetota bacterium]